MHLIPFKGTNKRNAISPMLFSLNPIKYQYNGLWHVLDYCTKGKNALSVPGSPCKCPCSILGTPEGSWTLLGIQQDLLVVTCSSPNCPPILVRNFSGGWISALQDQQSSPLSPLPFQHIHMFILFLDPSHRKMLAKKYRIWIISFMWLIRFVYTQRQNKTLEIPYKSVIL